GSGLDIGRQNAQRIEVALHLGDGFLDQRLGRNAALARSLDDLVVHVGDVADVGYVIAAGAQVADHGVPHHVDAGVAQGAAIVHGHTAHRDAQVRRGPPRRAAHVDAQVRRVPRLELDLAPRQRVEEANRQGRASRSANRLKPRNKSSRTYIRGTYQYDDGVSPSTSTCASSGIASGSISLMLATCVKSSPAACWPSPPKLFS